jgi:hypothetical protein
MQERENVHRGGWGLSVVLASGAVLFTLVFSTGAWAGASECSPCRLDFDRPGLPSQCVFPGFYLCEKSRAGVFSQFADPYMLDGLVACDLRAGFETPSHSVWLGWHRLAHSLYREDDLAADLWVRLPIRGLRLGAAPASQRREVRGFAAAQSHSLSLALSYECAHRVLVGYTRAVYESDPGAPRQAAVFILLRGGSFGAAFNRIVSGERGGDSRIALEVCLGNRCSIVSGYRWKTGELASEVLIEIASMLFDLSWSQNPALGSTVSAGVGRWWEW